MHIFYQPDIASGVLPEEESKHAVRVLRLEAGTEIQITDGKGNFYKAVITGTDPRACRVDVIETTHIPLKNYFIHLAIAPTKNADRIEWMLEKCVEIGIDKVSFIQCKTSERKNINLERLEKIIVSAMKQSQKAWLPEVSPLIPFRQFISEVTQPLRYIAYVDSHNPDHLKSIVKPGGSYLILIGPEGDFSNEELELAISSGFRKVSLGPSRLRTETAGLAAVMTLNILNQ